VEQRAGEKEQVICSYFLFSKVSEHMKAKWKLALLNAGVGAGIAFLSSLPLHIPTSFINAVGNVCAALIGAGLAFLFQIKPLLEKELNDEEKYDEKMTQIRIESRRLRQEVDAIHDQACDDVATAKKDSREKVNRPRVGMLVWW